MTAFATPDELAQFLQQPLASWAGGQLLLDMATSLIQDEARQQLWYVQNDSVELRGTWSHLLRLPERPVIDITAVKIRNGSVFSSEIPLTANVDYRWDRMGLLRRVSYLTGRLLAPTSGYWGGEMAVVDVTYSHGWATPPPQAKALCLSVAARVYTNPAGIVRETIGNYAVVFDRQVPGFSLTAQEAKMARRLGKAA